jgi:hypothetical protein
VMACPACNLDKGASDPHKWIWTTSRIPDSRRELLDSLIPEIKHDEESSDDALPSSELSDNDPLEFELVQPCLFED